MSHDPALSASAGEVSDEVWRPPPHRALIRLMGEHGVTVPLWSDEDGLMFGEPSELIQAFDVSSVLARDLEAWSVAWGTRAGEPSHDAEAARLVRRLIDELDHYYRFVYRP